MIETAVNIGVVLVWLQAGIGLVLLAVLAISGMIDIILRHGDFDREFFYFLVEKAKGKIPTIQESDDENDDDKDDKEGSSSGE